MAIGAGHDSESDAPLDTEAMLREEFAHVLGDSSWTDLKAGSLAQRFSELHAQPTDQRPSALCLSGGGIRSATFGLGVLQWLAGHGQLKHFHYLSTVSGGGYIGSWLVNGLWQAGRGNPAGATDWLHRVGQSAGCVGSASAAGAAHANGTARDPVAPLRGFSNYLSPTGGLSGDAFSLAAIFVRNLLLNALVWLPLLAAIVALPRLYIAWLAAPAELVQLWVAGACVAVAAGAFAAIVVCNLSLRVQGAVLVVLVVLALLLAAPLAGLVAAPRLHLWLALIPVFDYALVASAWLAIIIGVAYVVADLPSPRDVAPVTTTPDAQARQAAAADESTSPSNRFFLACFAPIALAAIVLSIGGAWIATLREVSLWWFAAAGALAHWLGVPVGVRWRLARGLSKRRNNLAAGVGVFVVGIVGAFGGVLALVVLSQLAAAAGPAESDGSQRLMYATFAVPAMTGAFWLSMALYAGLMGRFTDEHDREWWARATGTWLKFSVLWVVAFGLVVWLPLPILDRFGATGPTAVQFGIGGGVLGIVTSLIGYWSKNGADLKRKAQGFLRATRLKLLDAMAALVVLATLLATSLGWSAALDRCHSWNWAAWLCVTDLHAETEYLREQTRLRFEHQAASKGAAGASAREPFDHDATEPGPSAAARVYRHVLLQASGWTVLAAVAALAFAAAGFALATGVNVFSLHGMYGNRLVRAYLGTGRAQRRAHWFTGFDPDDNPKLHLLDAPLRTANGLPRLYPVLNIALNIVKPSPKHLDWQQRKAASFIATPRHCGADPVCYRPSVDYAGGMSLGRALTISGAAASPNMGYHSSALVTFVMTLFNVRLGWWAPNPGRPGARWKKEHPWIGLDVAWAEATGNTGVDDRFVYLSDGGHFDNLGIYEMVRRRCHRIVAIDATCDGKFKWTDLLEVVRKIRVDFGIPIELPSVLPGPGRDTPHPRRIEAPIRYSARDGNDKAHDGMLIVLKPRLLPEQDSPELAAYAAASAADSSPPNDPARFPHQSTADQFFNEQQFESYRLLGYLTAADALGAKPAQARSQAHKLGRRAAAAIVPAASPAAGAGAAGTPADEAGAGGIGYLIHQMGSGAALATALTIGGTLGVAGTVALAPTELKLSDADRALLKDGMPLRVDAPDLKLNDADRSLLREAIRDAGDASVSIERTTQLNSATLALVLAVNKFFADQPKPASSPGATRLVIDPQLLTAVNSLKDEIGQLNDRIRAKAPSDTGDLTSAVTQLRRTLESIESRLPKEPTLAKALTDLKNAVDNIAPRKNVRGQEGGTR